MGALVVLAAQAGTVEPGGTGSCVVLIRNLAAERDDFDVLVHGDASAWATVDPAAVSLAPDEEVPVWVRFDIPRDPSIAAGPVDFAVTVSSRSDPEFIHAERATVDVGAFTKLSAALEPIDDEGPDLQVAIRLENAGNAAARATVAVRDGEIDPRTVIVGPQQTERVVFDLRRRRGLEDVVVEVDATDGTSFSLATPVAALDRARSSLRRDLTRSALVLGALLVMAFVAVATIGGNDPDGSEVETGALGTVPTTVAGAPAGDQGAGQPTADTAPTSATATTPSAVAASTSASRPPAPAPADLPALVFVRAYGPGERDIVVRAAGGGETRLRSPGTVETYPALSPDQSTVAFVQEQGGQWRVCVVATTGGDPRCLFDVSATSSVAWRRDGAALYATQEGQLVEVAVDPTLSYAYQPIVHPVAVPGGRFALSPDGTQVAVVDAGKIVVRPIDGGDGVALRVPGDPEDPVWAPDGQRIVYTADTQIQVAPLGDGPVRQLTAPQTVNGDPVVAGAWVVFRSNRTGNGDLYAVRLDGVEREETGLAAVTRSTERDTDPSI